MNLHDLNSLIIIENPRGSYKKFADTTEEYPILGVTFPTDYGYIQGYIGEDNHDLDVFIGSGSEHGILRVNRDDISGGIETKVILNVTETEYAQIMQAYQPVIHEITKISSEALFDLLPKFSKK